MNTATMRPSHRPCHAMLPMVSPLTVDVVTKLHHVRSDITEVQRHLINHEPSNFQHQSLNRWRTPLSVGSTTTCTSIVLVAGGPIQSTGVYRYNPHTRPKASPKARHLGEEQGERGMQGEWSSALLPTDYSTAEAVDITIGKEEEPLRVMGHPLANVQWLDTQP